MCYLHKCLIKCLYIYLAEIVSVFELQSSKSVNHYNDTQHFDYSIMTLSTLSIMTIFSITTLNITIFSTTILSIMTLAAECCYVVLFMLSVSVICYAECRYVEWYCAECCDTLKWSILEWPLLVEFLVRKCCQINRNFTNIPN